VSAKNAAIAAPALSREQVEVVRAHHRGTRNAGYVACLIGVMAMVAGRYMPGVPGWLANVGFGAVVFGWGLFAYALFRRVALARSFSSNSGG
jgi:hypothetical protein